MFIHVAMGAMKEHTHVCKLAQRWSREGGGERDRKGGGDSERDPSCPAGEKEKRETTLTIYRNYYSVTQTY